SYVDFASWDSYPLGFTELMPLAEPDKVRYARCGHPDAAAFHHDLYRSMGPGRFWVMEQQPGPVNWAPWNPSPAPGMVRLWTWEARAHGADAVCYFRWRQAANAQEQMHAGLNRTDDTPDAAWPEIEEVGQELTVLSDTKRSIVALLFDYETAWMLDIQPQGADFRYLDLVFESYQALRRLGLNVDVVSSTTDLGGYRLVLAPCWPVLRPVDLGRAGGTLVLGPRSGSRTKTFGTATPPVDVLRVESLRPGLEERLLWGERSYPVQRWREWLSGEAGVEAKFGDGRPAVIRHGATVYIGCWPPLDFLVDWLEVECQRLRIATWRLPADVRVRQRGDVSFMFNFGTEVVHLSDGYQWVLGGPEVAPCGLSAWRTKTVKK
ncbi:MAG TPA: beta-galactosidase, partial [Candidatus Xenobia bacterium]